MSTHYLIAIAAMSRNRVIGKDGRIPWACKEDMEWFKRTTTGHTVIMGRKTWEGIRESPLKHRKHMVLTSTPRPFIQWDKGFSLEFFQEPENVVGLHERAFVIGGAQTYTALMPWTREILLTVIDIEVEGDTHFPEIPDGFELKSTTPLSERAVVHHYVRR